MHCKGCHVYWQQRSFITEPTPKRCITTKSGYFIIDSRRVDATKDLVADGIIDDADLKN